MQCNPHPPLFFRISTKKTDPFFRVGPCCARQFEPHSRNATRQQRILGTPTVQHDKARPSWGHCACIDTGPRRTCYAAGKATSQAAIPCELSRCKRTKRTQTATPTHIMITVSSHNKLHCTFTTPSQGFHVSSKSAVDRNLCNTVRSCRATKPVTHGSLNNR